MIAFPLVDAVALHYLVCCPTFERHHHQPGELWLGSRGCHNPSIFSQSSEFRKFSCFVRNLTFAVGKDKGFEIYREIFELGPPTLLYSTSTMVRSCPMHHSTLHELPPHVPIPLPFPPPNALRHEVCWERHTRRTLIPWPLYSFSEMRSHYSVFMISLIFEKKEGEWYCF